MRLMVIHGPNLDRLGHRQPEIYGTETLDEINASIEKLAAELGIDVEIHQSAREGRIIELLSDPDFDGAVVNPAAYSHTSRAIGDAIAGAGFPVIEVHISNIHAREEWRRVSVTAESCVGVIGGLGRDGYLLALRWMAAKVGD